MAIHKSIDKICVAVIILAVIITALFMNGEKFGIVAVVDEDAETNEDKSYFTENDKNGDWDETGATVISLNGQDASISGGGAYSYDGNVVISGAGYYVISGELDNGNIVVDAYDSSKVFIKLKGVKVGCEDDACFRVDQADKVFLSVEEDTYNYFESGSEYCDSAVNDGTKGAFFAHDDLTINGKGDLVIKAGYGHGIDANDDLIITGGNIEILAVQDGIHVKDSIRIMDAGIDITAEDDGIVSKNEDGYFYMESGNVNIVSDDDGIHTLGNVMLAGGELTIQAADDAIHSEKNIKITDGDIDIPSCHEGLEAVSIDVTSGNISVYPEDDGFNANTSEQGGDTYINISGGNIKIVNENAQDADGLDSNGSIYISGGEVFISLPGSGSNNAIDYASESNGICEINGGNIIACGGSAMAEEMSSSSSQCSIFYTLSSQTQAGDTLELTDSQGTKLISREIPLSFNLAVISTPELKLNETYTFSVGDVSEEITLEYVSSAFGTSSSGMGGMGKGDFTPQGRTDEEGDFTPPDGTDEEGDFTPPDGTDEEGGFTPPDRTDEEGDFTPPEGMDGEEGFTRREVASGQNGREMMQGGGQMPGQTPNDEEDIEDNSVSENVGKTVTSRQWIWLGVSVAVLIAGLAFSIIYKKRW